MNRMEVAICSACSKPLDSFAIGFPLVAAQHGLPPVSPATDPRLLCTRCRLRTILAPSLLTDLTIRRNNPARYFP